MTNQSLPDGYDGFGQPCRMAIGRWDGNPIRIDHDRFGYHARVEKTFFCKFIDLR